MVINGLRSPKKLPSPWQPIPFAHSSEKEHRGSATGGTRGDRAHDGADSAA